MQWGSKTQPEKDKLIENGQKTWIGTLQKKIS